MPFTTLNLGLLLTIPTVGTRNWGQTLYNTTWTRISQHTHTGSGDGAPIPAAGIQADAITEAKIRLANNTYLRWRNAANSGDVSAWKVDALDQLKAGVTVNLLQGATLTPASTAQTVNWATGNIQRLGLGSATGDVTLTLSGAQQGALLLMLIEQGATPRDLIWPAAVKWPQAQKPILSTVNGAVDKVLFYYDGTNYYGDWDLNYS